MKRFVAAALLGAMLSLEGWGFRLVDADTGETLPQASLFNRAGAIVDITSDQGEIPSLPPGAFPVTVRHIGYSPLTLEAAPQEDVALTRAPYSLPAVEVGTQARPVLHTTAYIREFHTDATDTDTIVTYNEYLADFFFAPDGTRKFKAHREPRALGRRGVARFTNAQGRDSVARNPQDFPFPWLDLATLPNFEINVKDNYDQANAAEPLGVSGRKEQQLTRLPNAVVYTIDRLANEKNHVYSPTFAKIIGATADFTELSATLLYGVDDEALSRAKVGNENLQVASLTYDVLGRGKMFRWAFNTKSAIRVRLYYEVYPIDHEHLTVDEAKALLKEKPSLIDNFPIPEGLPPLDPATQALLNRASQLPKPADNSGNNSDNRKK